FRWTPCGSDDLRFLSPEWIRSGPEIRTWCSLVPILFFNLIQRHHVDRVIRQLGADQPMRVDLVNVDPFLTTTGRGTITCHPNRACNSLHHLSTKCHNISPSSSTTLVLHMIRLVRVIHHSLRLSTSTTHLPHSNSITIRRRSSSITLITLRRRKYLTIPPIKLALLAGCSSGSISAALPALAPTMSI
ncbi:hypothetical protein PIB30_081317, partial [Stylosanthes scabra]|nr:hypothetical protein [Stylosanthes scabra]